MAGTTIGGSLARGLLAGAAGTAGMTVYQIAVAKARGRRASTPVPRTWAEAPAPAQIVKKAATAVGRGRSVTKQDVPRLTNAVHWLYGLTWGLAYGAVVHSLRPPALAGAVGLGTALWGMQYAELVPLGIAKPPWEQPPQELALDLSYHLVYGVGVAAAYGVLD
jgi:hypothetical protein